MYAFSIDVRSRCLAAAALLAVVLSACGSGPQHSTGPARSKKALSPLPPPGRGGPAGARAVAFRADDGLGLRGRLFGQGEAAVVLAHMGGAANNEADWYPLARRLAHEGYMVLTYNRRGVCSKAKSKYDCSAGIDDYPTSWQDVVGAVRFVRTRGARSVAVAGASIGGTSAVYAAATGKIQPTALISLAGINYISTYSLDEPGLRRIGGAKLFISASGDADGGARSARQWNAWAEEPKRLVLLDSERHGTEMLGDQQPTRVPLTSLIVRFLRSSMPPDS